MPPPDLILHSGKIITLDRRSWRRPSLFDRVAAQLSATTRCFSDDRLVGLEDRSVLPRFIDAHPHADREGLKARGGIPIAGLHSVADIVNVIRHAAQTTPAGGWIVLMPMGEPPHEYISRPEQLTDGRFPTRHDLEAVTPTMRSTSARRCFVRSDHDLALANSWRSEPQPVGIDIGRAGYRLSRHALVNAREFRARVACPSFI